MAEPIPPIPIVVDTVRPERNVTEVFLLLLALNSAVISVAVAPEPVSVAALLGTTWAIAWGVGLFAGAVLALAGIFWRGKALTAASLMGIGYMAFAPASLARGVALVELGRVNEAVIVVAFAVACLLRVWQIEHRIGRSYPTGLARTVRRWLPWVAP